MKFERIHLPLATTPAQATQLAELQHTFAEACNRLAQVVRDHRCWNRVALHHLAYHGLREAMPALGAQMTCNAIYSVCRAARLVFQNPHSPFYHARWVERPLPLLRFAPDCPVYFDRHTLSLRHGRISLYTLDGRLHFDLSLSAPQEAQLQRLKLREIVLAGRPTQGYVLTFWLHDEGAAAASADAAAGAHPSGEEWPQYLMVEATT